MPLETLQRDPYRIGCKGNKQAAGGLRIVQERAVCFGNTRGETGAIAKEFAIIFESAR